MRSRSSPSRAGLKVPYEGGREAPREDTTDLYAGARLGGGVLPTRSSARTKRRARISPIAGSTTRRSRRFNLGYAPDQWDALKNALGTSAQRIALLEKAGMLTSGERGSKYDRFRHRVMFPILDRRGRTIAFGGRVLVKEDTPKYLNSPETPLFHKGRELFGLWQVREAHQKIPRLIVVEGYMDVISLHQFGVPQAVATLGTATTRDHAEMLFRQCADVYFCFDGDRAGRQAAWRAVESVLPRMRDGRQAMFLFLPDGEDPDTLIRQEGTAGFRGTAQERDAAQRVLLRRDRQGRESREPRRQGAPRRARAADARADSGWRVPRSDARRARSPDRRARASRGAADATRRTRNRRRVRSSARWCARRSRCSCRHPRSAAAIEPPWTFAELRQPGIPLLVELIALCRDRPDITTGALIEHFAEREEAKCAAEARGHGFPGRRGREPRGVPRCAAPARSADRNLQRRRTAARGERSRRQGIAGLSRSSRRTSFARCRLRSIAAPSRAPIRPECAPARGVWCRRAAGGSPIRFVGANFLYGAATVFDRVTVNRDLMRSIHRFAFITTSRFLLANPVSVRDVPRPRILVRVVRSKTNVKSSDRYRQVVQ